MVDVTSPPSDQVFAAMPLDQLTEWQMELQKLVRSSKFDEYRQTGTSLGTQILGGMSLLSDAVKRRITQPSGSIKKNVNAENAEDILLGADTHLINPVGQRIVHALATVNKLVRERQGQATVAGANAAAQWRSGDPGTAEQSRTRAASMIRAGQDVGEYYYQKLMTILESLLGDIQQCSVLLNNNTPIIQHHAGAPSGDQRPVMIEQLIMYHLPYTINVAQRLINEVTQDPNNILALRTYIQGRKLNGK